MMQYICTHNVLRLHSWHCPALLHATSRARQRAPPTRALLPQPLDTIVDGAAVLAAVGSIGLSALPLLTGEAAKVNAGRPVDSDVEEEDFTFGVMSGVSLLPYANWTVRATRLTESPYVVVAFIAYGAGTRVIIKRAKYRPYEYASVLKLTSLAKDSLWSTPLNQACMTAWSANLGSGESAGSRE